MRSVSRGMSHAFASTMRMKAQVGRSVPAASLIVVTLTAPCIAQEEVDAARPRTPAVPEVNPGTPAGIFGGKGQLAISSDAGLYIQNSSTSGVDGSATTLQLRPAFDYFLMDNLSLGGFLGVEYQSVPTGHSTTWAIGPRVGYNVAFSDKFSIWPKAGVSFASTSQSINPTPTEPTGTSISNTGLALNLFVPIMFHPVRHFFLGFGPALDVDLTGDVKTTTIAGRLTLGGWI